MMFTYGSTDSYALAFSQESKVFKLGIAPDRDDYQGGIVFETADEATEHLRIKGLTGYTVFGLDTTIDNRHRIDGENFWRLKTSCELIQLT